jgi:15-cis-phytoene synthase
MTATADSYAACRALTRAAGSSFPAAFRLLAPHKRDAMFALYAYMRVTDDLADEPGAPDTKRAKLAEWRSGLSAALDGNPTHAVHAALADTVRRYEIPPRYLFDAIDGCDTDAGPVRVRSFAELYQYCYRVASAVGLACVRIWGTRSGARFADTDAPAEAAGIAFQLTNILRDLAEDRSRDRVYLPEDELARFECPPEAWRDPACRAHYRDLMRFQVARARAYYRRGSDLLPLLARDGRAVFRVMSGAYQRLLDEIERRDFDVFTRRVRVPKWRKAAVFASGWLAKWGLL